MLAGGFPNLCRVNSWWLSRSGTPCRVGVGHAAGVDRYETACLKYLLESATVYGEVFITGKRPNATVLW